MPLLALALVSAGAIGFQIVLIRLYAIGQWHHFAFMIVSIALLGYGASGTFLALARPWLHARFAWLWPGFAVAFGLSAPASFLLARGFVFDPFALAWSPGKLAELSFSYLLLMVPFFCAANCIGLAFLRFGDRIGRIYRFDLTGAGLGASGAIALLFLLPPWDALRAVPLLGFAAAALVLAGNSGRTRATGLGLLAAGGLFAVALPAAWLMPRLSDYKALSLALLAPGAAILHQDSSPLSLVTVVDSPQVPIRHAPGLSLLAPRGPPPQLGLYRDADSPSAIPGYDGTQDLAEFLDWTTAALPYHLSRPERVLLLGSDGGQGQLLARLHGVRHIDLVEPDPAMARTLTQRFDAYAGGLFSAPGTRLAVTTPRAFVAGAAPGSYDLIVLTGTGGAGGLAGLSETDELTREAFVADLHRLAPDGLLSVSLPLTLPPRGVLKLVATAIAALRASGAAEPARQLFLIRTWNQATLAIAARPLGDAAISAGRDFAASRAFDLAYHPGLARAEANRFNLLAEPYLYDGTTALLGPGAADFLARYKFDLAPARDDRPYFHDVLRWSSLPELLALARRGAMPLIEWGPLIVLATLLQAALLSALLILLPLALRGRVPAHPGGPGRTRVAGYFLALGLGFLFLEIAFMQRLTLLLGHPLHAVALVLAAFLVSAGIGAGLSPRLAQALARRKSRVGPVAVAVGGILLAGAASLGLLALPLEGLAAAPIALRGLGAVALIAPLGFFLGMPFPLALADLARARPGLVPWAWGINGCASVIGAVLAALLALELGFLAVVGLAGVLYLAAAVLWRRVA